MHVCRGIWSIAVVLLWCCGLDLIFLGIFLHRRLGLAGLALAWGGQSCFCRRHAQLAQRWGQPSEQRLHQQGVPRLIACLQSHMTDLAAQIGLKKLG